MAVRPYSPGLIIRRPMGINGFDSDEMYQQISLGNSF